MLLLAEDPKGRVAVDQNLNDGLVGVVCASRYVEKIMSAFELIDGDQREAKSRKKGAIFGGKAIWSLKKVRIDRARREKVAPLKVLSGCLRSCQSGDKCYAEEDFSGLHRSDLVIEHREYSA